MSEAAGTPSYRLVQRSVRPPRAATLVCSGGDWRADVLRMLECSSRTWGGDGNGLVAIAPDWEIADPFWQLAEALDADHWAMFTRTARGLQMRDSQAYEALLADHVAQWMEQTGDKETEAREKIEPELLSARAGARAVAPDAVQDRIRRRMAPLASAQVAITAEYWADEPPSHGLVDMCALTHQPSRFTGIDSTGLPESVQLLVAARTGLVAPGHLAALRERGPVDHITQPAGDLPALLRFAWTGKPDAGTSYADPSFVADTPLAQSRLGCTWMTAFSPDMDREPVVVVCGDSAEDFCYAYTRRRVVAETYWLPTGADVEEVSKDLYDTLARVLDGLAQRPSGNRPVFLTSLTLDENQLQDVQNKLLATPWGRTFSSAQWGKVDVSVCAAADLPVVRHVALLDSVHFGDTMYEPFVGTDLARNVEIPLPCEAVGVTPDACRWQVDIQDPNNILPARWALREIATADGATAFGVRVSTAGVSVDSHGRMFTLSGMTLSQRLAQVRVRFPSAEALFTQLAAAGGATVERSDAGRRAAIAVEMWGSPDALSADLTGPTRRLLDTFLPPKGRRNGSYGSGYAIRDDGYVAIEDATETLEVGDDEARDLLDRLLAIQVLRRGLLLNCARCHFEAFYRIERVGSTFDCQACGHTSAMARGRWYKKDPEPHWYYAIDQVVRDLLKQHGDIPLLASGQLKKASSSLLWSPELSVTDAAGTIELDICLVLDGKVIIGEAKSNNTLKAGHSINQAASRLVHAAQILSADQIVLATSKLAWANSIRPAVDQAIRDSWTCGPRPVITELVNVGTT